ncbi:hypothetical protein [Candidatus Thiodiazotropha sp. CDECU1]|uniref:hypothetical protein n=1 Tax=Candidatus Thiodiazotropha sp. CDECU1 TaxID=3065865 RepID=UPI00292F6B2A|nr:hypothetical protein [Candidatus Thiodiazotropha sp. CDECU1]
MGQVIASALCSTVSNRTDFAEQASQDVAAVTAWKPSKSDQKNTYINDLIQSERPDGLLSETLQANPSPQKTLLSLRIRQAQRRQEQATRQPSIEAG